jgi:HEAT repeat protein
MKNKVAVLFVLASGLMTLARAGVESQVNDLIPRLAAAKEQERYVPQQELQALVANASRPGAEKERLELATVLAAKAADAAVPQPARVWIVRQLEYIGGGESVTGLTKLLNGDDAELRECARRALQKNSAPAAGEALRAALKQGGDATRKIGLVSALGERGDGAAVALIAPLATEPETAPAAIAALGKIATEPAVKALWALLERRPPVSTAADALVVAGNRLAQRGDSSAAKAVFSRLLHTSGLAQGQHSAAFVGLAKADASAAKHLVPVYLSTNNTILQTAAITVAREVWGANLTPELLKLYPKLPPSGKLLALQEFDTTAEKAVLGAMADPDESVRLAALEALGRIGGAESVLLLLKTGLNGAGRFRQVCDASLLQMPGKGVDASLVTQAGKSDPRLRAAAIKTLAARHYTAANAALLGYAADTNRVVSAAACAALGELGGDAEIDSLVKLALTGVPEAETALQSVAARATDKSVAASQLIARANDAPPAQVAMLYDTLGRLGGPAALKFVTGQLRSEKPETRDAAVRALANWSDYGAVEPLLAIAADPGSSPVHAVLALQGAVRLAKTADDQNAATRLATLEKAMGLAKRVEDKKQVLSALGAVTDAKAAAALKPYLSDPEMKNEAGLAAASLARDLSRSNRTAARELAQAVKAAGLPDSITRQVEPILRRQ